LRSAVAGAAVDGGFLLGSVWTGGDGPNASGDLHFARTHPTSPVRFLQMQKVAEEIAEKQRNHLPLVPDLKTAAGP
jgi:hypothetical protein